MDFRSESANRSENASHRKGGFCDARRTAQIACFGPILETGQTGTLKTSVLNFWVCDQSSSCLCLLLQLETHGVQRFLTIMLSICCLYAVWFRGGTHPIDLGPPLEHNCCDTLSTFSLLGFEWFCFHKTLSIPNYSSRMCDAHGNA